MSGTESPCHARCSLHGDAFTTGCPGCDVAMAEQNVAVAWADESSPPDSRSLDAAISRISRVNARLHLLDREPGEARFPTELRLLHEAIIILEALERDTSAADVDGAEQSLGHHESVGERQGRQPAPEMPPDLVRALGDPTIILDRDHEVRLSDGRTLHEHLEEWRNAPSNTASAHIEQRSCPHGDPACPCPDGLACHYEGDNPWPRPGTTPAIEGES